MATRNEKVMCSILGLITGAFFGNEYFKRNNLPKENRWEYILGGGLGGSITGYGLACLFGSPNDTVNYTHFNKGKRVYEGITYADRFNTRMAEHKESGKIFTRVVKDVPKPRIEAIKLEKERILKYKPVNNIQHNS